MTTQKISFSIILYLCLASHVAAAKTVLPAPLVSITQHEQFFAAISKHCGKAFKGEITADNMGGDGFANKDLIMHVRVCTENQIQIPFFVGDDASRTWIISKTGSGLNLKHDHRNEDGSYHESTMYGGHTLDAGWPTWQSFPADQYSKQLFIKLGIPQSNDNTWQVGITDTTYTYRLMRPAREFKVEFDLTNPIPVPAAPWGYRD